MYRYKSTSSGAWTVTPLKSLSTCKLYHLPPKKAQPKNPQLISWSHSRSNRSRCHCTTTKWQMPLYHYTKGVAFCWSKLSFSNWSFKRNSYYTKHKTSLYIPLPFTLRQVLMSTKLDFIRRTSEDVERTKFCFWKNTVKIQVTISCNCKQHLLNTRCVIIH